MMAPRLPQPRGDLSAAVIGALTRGHGLPSSAPDDPLGGDAQLALHLCYELHYRGFAGVDPDLEWDPDLLRFRACLERVFLAELRDRTAGGSDVGAVLDELLVEPLEATGVSHHLRDAGQWWQLQEYLAHRSIYHLKEADPHAWVIPRLQGRAKAALVAVEFDEFGGGRAERMHSTLFADLLDEVGLESSYGHYLDIVPAVTLATVNLMSLFGSHRYPLCDTSHRPRTRPR